MSEARKRTAGEMRRLLAGVLEDLNTVILGKPEVVRLCLAALLARGHVLIEDVPGVGKTTLAMALSRCLGLGMKRIQFTSDMLPGDVVGTSVFEAGSAGVKGSFVFHPGALFSEVVMADEINRASPKTQSALLEAMEEGRVSVDGVRHRLPEPFFVLATQNPGSQRGTYPLPESQLDRFMIKTSIGFPGREAERTLLSGPSPREAMESLKARLESGDLVAAQAMVEEIETAVPILDYVLDLLEATRIRGDGAAGLSPRAGMSLVKVARAWAFLAGRPMVIPEDVQEVAPAVLGHRLTAASGAGGGVGEAMVKELLARVPLK